MKRHIEGGGQLRLRPPWVIKILGFQVFEAPMGEMPPPRRKKCKLSGQIPKYAPSGHWRFKMRL